MQRKVRSRCVNNIGTCKENTAARWRILTNAAIKHVFHVNQNVVRRVIPQKKGRVYVFECSSEECGSVKRQSESHGAWQHH